MNITEKVKNYEDICAIDGVDPIQSLPFPEAKNSDEEAINSVAKVFRINRVLNEGWVPNWYDWDEYKYYPYFDMSPNGKGDGKIPGSGSGFSFSDYDCVYGTSVVGARLVYKTRELAKFAGETFTQEYRGFMVLESK